MNKQNRMPRRWSYLFLSCLFIFSPFSLFSQEAGGVTSTVTDQVSNEPLIGVSIKVKDRNLSTSTDAEGNFVINASDAEILQFSYIGYKDTEVTVTVTSLNVIMKENRAHVDEVVVLVIVSQKRSELTRTIRRVSA